MVRAIISGAAAMAMPAAAMVPLNMQRQGELRQVANLPGLVERLGEPAERIARVGERLWRVTAGRCHVDVSFVRVPGVAEGLTGPRYAPRLGERVCAR